MDVGVAIIGAGPYGLATAAHLRQRGRGVLVFGRVMGAWEQMPAAMLLRSFREATSIGDPDGVLTIDAFERERGRAIPTPVPISDFVEYGRWFREQAVPEIDPKHVRLVDHDGRSFRLTLTDGAELTAERVVVAAGIAPFAHVPPELLAVDHGRVTHSSAHSDFSHFRGRRVVVVGAGQSGLEWGVLAHDAGADVEVVSRRPLRFASTTAPDSSARCCIRASASVPPGSTG
jgi:cation diffusion facilitator CzcD-associated flavoprotein CzcO